MRASCSRTHAGPNPKPHSVPGTWPPPRGGRQSLISHLLFLHDSGTCRRPSNLTGPPRSCTAEAKELRRPAMLGHLGHGPSSIHWAGPGPQVVPIACSLLKALPRVYVSPGPPLTIVILLHLGWPPWVMPPWDIVYGIVVFSTSLWGSLFAHLQPGTKRL